MQKINLFINMEETTSDLDVAGENGDFDTVINILEQADIDPQSENYFLAWAAMCGYLPVVKYLVKQGVDIRANDDFAMIYAIKGKHQDVVDFLKAEMKIRKEEPFLSKLKRQMKMIYRKLKFKIS